MKMKLLRFILLISLIGGIIGGGFLFLIARGMSPPTYMFVREYPLNSSTIKVLTPFFQEAPYISFLANGNILIVGKSIEGGFQPLLLLEKRGKGRVLWVNSKPYGEWFVPSPDSRFIAYPGPEEVPGVWVLDLEKRRARLVAPKTRDGKVLFSLSPWFLDAKHLVIQRVKKELLEMPPPHSHMEKYLTAKEKERMRELLDRFLKGQFRQRDEAELLQLMRKAFALMKKEEIEEEIKQAQSLQLLSSGIEERIVDLDTGVEETLIEQGNRILSLSPDREWFYVLDITKHKVYKVKVGDRSQKQELLSWHYPGLRIAKEEPLEVGIAYPPPQYKCYCYKKRDDKLVLSKTISYGDNRFPRDSIVRLAPNIKYSIAYGKEGLFIKDLGSKEVAKMDGAAIGNAQWNKSGTVVAYARKDGKFYEVWLLDVITRQKRRVFP